MIRVNLNLWQLCDGDLRTGHLELRQREPGKAYRLAQLLGAYVHLSNELPRHKFDPSRALGSHECYEAWCIHRRRTLRRRQFDAESASTPLG